MHLLIVYSSLQCVGLLKLILVLLSLFAFHNRETTIDDHYGYHMDHPMLKLQNFRVNLLTFKQYVEEPITELWLRFKEISQTCLSSRMQDKTLFDCFYKGLKPESRRIVEHIFEGGMMSKPYKVAATFLKKWLKQPKRLKRNTSGIN